MAVDFPDPLTPNQRHRLPRLHLPGEALEHHVVGGVGKLHALELHLLGHSLQHLAFHVGRVYLLYTIYLLHYPLPHHNCL